MKKGDTRNKKGFTIIEVSLVLAVAGLIFLMIFIALPALQRSQRDTQRRDDMMELISKIKKYQQNNRGALPTGLSSGVVFNNETTDKTTWEGFYKNYLGDNFTDPSDDGRYVLDVSNCGDMNPGEACLEQYNEKSFDDVYNHVAIILSATCDGEKALKTSNPRKLAILYHLELGVYCGNT